MYVKHLTITGTQYKVAVKSISKTYLGHRAVITHRYKETTPKHYQVQLEGMG